MSYTFKVGDLVTREPGDDLGCSSFIGPEGCIFLSSLPLSTVYRVHKLSRYNLELSPTSPEFTFSNSSNVEIGGDTTRLRPYHKYLLRRRNGI